MKKLKVTAPRVQQLLARTQRKTEWLKAHGATRVLIVYDGEQVATVYPEVLPFPKRSAP